MNEQKKISLQLSNDDELVGYVYLPKHPRVSSYGIVKKTIALNELINDYKGIPINLDQQGKLVEMHLNKSGAEYLRDILIRLIQIDSDEHLHLMTPDWGWK